MEVGRQAGMFPIYNDIDGKYNIDNNTLRRVWSYFYDHTHSLYTL